MTFWWSEPWQTLFSCGMALNAVASCLYNTLGYLLYQCWVWARWCFTRCPHPWAYRRMGRRGVCGRGWVPPLCVKACWGMQLLLSSVVHSLITATDINPCCQLHDLPVLFYVSLSLSFCLLSILQNKSVNHCLTPIASISPCFAPPPIMNVGVLCVHGAY